MKVSKFLETKHLPSISSGKLLFKRFDAFHDNAFPIGDPLECRTGIDIDHYVHDPVYGSHPFGPGITIGPKAGGSVFSAFRMVYESELCWISCFATGDAKSMAPTMLNTPPFNYDAAIDIRNIEKVARRIWRYGSMPDGSSVQDYFGDLHFGSVIYQDTLQPTPDRGGVYLEPSPFIKNREFAFQQEYRISLEPIHGKEADIPDTFVVDCPFIEHLISIVYDRGKLFC